MDIFIPLFAIGAIFIGLPWILLHYLTQWRRTASLTADDEKLMEELYETARRLDDRLQTIERIIAADHPDYRQPTPAYREPGFDQEPRHPGH